MQFLLRFSSFLLAILTSFSLVAQQSPQGGATEKPTGRGDIYKRKNMEQRFPLKYHHLEEKDIVWEKRVWRTIDVREKINNPFRYEKKPLITILMDAARSREISIYAPDDDKRENRFVDTMPLADLNSTLFRVDTIITLDEWGNEKPPTFVTKAFDPASVVRYTIEEVWFFDEENSRMGVRIVGIAPKAEMEVKGYGLTDRPLFWIYYPEARDILSKNPAFSPSSDVDVMSWEDIFEMRFFSSYIIKESNVYDRRVQDYKQAGTLDLLYESENIHMSIFNLEQGSWEY